MIFFIVSGKWLGLTSFEMLIHMFSFFIFTILLALKVDKYASFTWLTVFAPVFICDIVNLYFRLIAYFRLFLEVQRENVFFARICKTQTIAFTWFMFKFLLYLKLSDEDSFKDASINPDDVSSNSNSGLSWIIVFSPLHVLMTGLVFCSCELRST